MVVGFLGHSITVILIVIGLLSGVLSVLREIQSMYFPAKSAEGKVFFVFVRIAFVIAAVLLWSDEHQKVVQLTSRSSDAHGHLLFQSQNSIVNPASNPKWPFKVGDVPLVNIAWKNLSHVYLMNFEIAGQFTLVPKSSFGESDKDFEEFLANAKYISGATVPNNGDMAYFTYHGPQLQATDIHDLLSGAAALAIMGRAKWQDDTGCYATDYIEAAIAEPWGPPYWIWHSTKRDLLETPIPCKKGK